MDQISKIKEETALASYSLNPTLPEVQKAYFLSDPDSLVAVGNWYTDQLIYVKAEASWMAAKRT